MITSARLGDARLWSAWALHCALSALDLLGLGTETFFFIFLNSHMSLYSPTILQGYREREGGLGAVPPNISSGGPPLYLKSPSYFYRGGGSNARLGGGGEN